jgi:hypothetical protein
MRNVETFLAAVAAKRQAEQERNRPALALPPDFTLPRDLEIAAMNRWMVRPVIAQSLYAADRAKVGIPDNMRAQIDYWDSLYKGCNWELTVGRDSGVIAVTADMWAASESLRLLYRGDWTAFESTLRFESGAYRWIALFHYAENILRRRLPGLRVLSEGETILVPPSRLDRGIELCYTDPFAAPADQSRGVGAG